MAWDWSDCKHDARFAKTSFCKTSFISTCFRSLSPKTNTKTSPRTCGGLLTILRPLRLPRREHIPSWFCKIKSNPNQPLSLAFDPMLILSSMLQIYHIGSLNHWLNYICNKTFCLFHIVVTSTQTMMISFYVEDQKETMKKPRESANSNSSQNAEWEEASILDCRNVGFWWKWCQ